MQRFPDGARVCFVGDSITHNGRYIAHIVSYYRKHFPEVHVEFYNCGISGGNLANVLKIYREDIATYDPTHIVLMIGVNDSRRGLLGQPRSAERYDALVDAYRQYVCSLEEFYRLTEKEGITLILCTPMPYAEYSPTSEAPLHGAHALMQGYAAYVREFASAHDLALCDYHTAATELLQTESFYRPDAIHPTERGHFHMAKIFLSSQGLSLDEEEEFPADVQEWLDVSMKLRNVIATEYFMVPDYTSKSREERIRAVHERLASVNAGESIMEYFKNLMIAYVTDKDRQEQFVSEIQALMKKK